MKLRIKNQIADQKSNCGRECKWWRGTQFADQSNCKLQTSVHHPFNIRDFEQHSQFWTQFCFSDTLVKWALWCLLWHSVSVLIKHYQLMICLNLTPQSKSAASAWLTFWTLIPCRYLTTSCSLMHILLHWLWRMERVLLRSGRISWMVRCFTWIEVTGSLSLPTRSLLFSFSGPPPREATYLCPRF
jgi:hypothetical protein